MSAPDMMRDHLRQAFAEVLAEIALPQVWQHHVENFRGVLRICDDLHDLSRYSRIFTLAIGKAAHPMAEALVAQIGPAASGIISSAHDPGAQLPGFRYFRGGHPVPNEESLRAAEAALKALRGLNADSLAIFLISGGGSAVFEKPLDDGISLDDMAATYRELVLCGAPIAEINAIRKHLSAVKGGRLAEAAQPAQQVSILVSDVPDNALDALASGPSVADSSTEEDCYRIVQEHGLLPRLPASVRSLFEERALGETPKKDDAAFVRSRWWTILSSASSARAAASFMSRMGFAVEIDNHCDDWEYTRAADYLLERLRRMRAEVSRACIISAGEVTVKVGERAGIGGRNLQFALYCAQRIASDTEAAAVLSAGTDGIDGNSPAAGAVADHTTISRAATAGIDAAAELSRFNAFPVFEKLGDAIVTGPTGNNVRDLRVLIAG